MTGNPFEPFLEIIPWPVIILNESGEILCTSDDYSHATASVDTASEVSLRERFSYYLEALAGPSAWLIPQEVEITRESAQGATVHEKLIVRRARWGACIIVVDQTELQSLQTANLQTARLAALGFMVAGVAHEISNPLTSIHSIVQLMRSESSLEAGLMKLGLENISVNVKRILEISRRLVTFSRVGDEPRTWFPIDRVIDESMSGMREGQFFSRIDLRLIPDPGAMVFGNSGQLREVFVNLVVNAAQAMEGRGTVTVTTFRPQADSVRVTVADDGPGIPAQIAAKIFEPFFTTKPSGQGTGLGLAVSNQIVQEHGGRLWLDTAGGPGAVFHLELAGRRS